MQSRAPIPSLIIIIFTFSLQFLFAVEPAIFDYRVDYNIYSDDPGENLMLS